MDHVLSSASRQLEMLRHATGAPKSEGAMVAEHIRNELKAAFPDKKIQDLFSVTTSKYKGKPVINVLIDPSMATQHVFTTLDSMREKYERLYPVWVQSQTSSVSLKDKRLEEANKKRERVETRKEDAKYDEDGIKRPHVMSGVSPELLVVLTSRSGRPTEYGFYLDGEPVNGVDRSGLSRADMEYYGERYLSNFDRLSGIEFTKTYTYEAMNDKCHANDILVTIYENETERVERINLLVAYYMEQKASGDPAAEALAAAAVQVAKDVMNPPPAPKPEPVSTTLVMIGACNLADVPSYTTKLVVTNCDSFDGSGLPPHVTQLEVKECAAFDGSRLSPHVTHLEVRWCDAFNVVPTDSALIDLNVNECDRFDGNHIRASFVENVYALKCPLFMGTSLPASLKSLYVSDCDAFKGDALLDGMTYLQVSNCGGFIGRNLPTSLRELHVVDCESFVPPVGKPNSTDVSGEFVFHF
jgi:hypothetical protein